MLVVCFLVIISSSVLAQDVTPFNTSNQSPIIQVHGLPFIDRGTVLSSGSTRYRLISDTSNNFTKASLKSESVLFDGETGRTTFSFSRGLPNGLEWGVYLPYVNHSGGTLDHFVENWHNLFGLPQKNRDTRPRNQLVYRYTRDGITRLSLTESASGLGDVQIHGAWQWQKAHSVKDANLAIRTQVTLPTGDSDNLLGSGGLDLAFWISGDRKETWFSYPGNLWGGAGILLLGDGEVLEGQQRNIALFSSIGSGAALTPWISLKLQLDYHSPLYKNSRLVQINNHALQFIIGGDIRLAKNTRLDLAVKEDPTVNASPDVVFHIGLTIDR